MQSSQLSCRSDPLCPAKMTSYPEHTGRRDVSPGSRLAPCSASTTATEFDASERKRLLGSRPFLSLVMETRMHHHHGDDHDDMGGLHRDLAATGAVMDRRGMLRLAARFGVGAGMLQMLGCGSGTPTSPTTGGSGETTTPSSGGTTEQHLQRHPAGDRRPVPGRRFERPERPQPHGCRAQRHPFELRRPQRRRRRRSADHRAHHRVGVDVRAAGGSGGLPLALRPRPGDTRSTPPARPIRTILRGVQAADSNGQVTFTSIFPGCYSGRWPHIHFEVYPSLSAATDVAQQDRDLADRAAEGRVRSRLRDAPATQAA